MPEYAGEGGMNGLGYGAPHGRPELQGDHGAPLHELPSPVPAELPQMRGGEGLMHRPVMPIEQQQMQPPGVGYRREEIPPPPRMGYRSEESASKDGFAREETPSPAGLCHPEVLRLRERLRHPGGPPQGLHGAMHHPGMGPD